jgi:hypothetical protein
MSNTSSERPSTTTERERFQRWLLKHRRYVKETGLRTVLKQFEGSITWSSAYRLALTHGLRGGRRNRSRYDRFWNTVNWELPDNVLSIIWGVGRGNMRQRRLRLGVASTCFNARHDRDKPSFQILVQRERERAARFRDPRPH